MNLIKEQINDIRQRLQNFDDGTLDAGDFKMALDAHSETTKILNTYLKGVGMAMQMGQPIDGTVMQQMLGDGNMKKVKKLENRTATRGRSGKKKK